MSTDQVESQKFKDGQREQWDAAAAGWKKWWELIERSASPASASMLDAARVQAGHRVLDVATGIGEPAVSAARRVGPDGHVLATDQAPKMLAIARERAATEGLGNLEFREFDGEALDVPAGSFDAALCRWGLMFLPDPAAAVAGMHAALKPGGSIAVATWSVPPKVPMLSVAMGVLGRELKLPAPPAGAPGPFSLANPDVLSALLTDAGFTDVSVEGKMLDFEYETAEVYIESLKDLAAPVVALVNGQPQERRQQLWDAIRDAVGPFTLETGAIKMPSETLIASGRRA